MSIARSAQIIIPAALWLTLLGCEDPAKNKPKAVVSSASPVGEQAAGNQAAIASAEALTIDPASSSLGFVGSKVTGKHEGTFSKFSGTITLAGGKAEGGSLRVEIDPSSVKTDSEKLDGHLKSPDFFDVEKFSKATFRSTEIKAGGSGSGTHTIVGELDLHGVKKTISFPATITIGADSVSGTSEFAINRKDFNINYPGKVDDLIRDEVVIKLSIKAPRKKS